MVQPQQPIRVILARDEELGLVGPEAGGLDLEKALPPPPPPAYGLWRNSMVCLLHLFSDRTKPWVYRERIRT